jgi:hypothetical protein
MVFDHLSVKQPKAWNEVTDRQVRRRTGTIRTPEKMTWKSENYETRRHGIISKEGAEA